MCFFCFNCFAPASDETCVRVPPANFTFINGLAYGYEEGAFPKTLQGRLTKNQYYNIISEINDKLGSYMPCPGLTCIGYLLAIPTLGLSWLLMWLCCVRSAENAVRKAIVK